MKIITKGTEMNLKEAISGRGTMLEAGRSRVRRPVS
jgi:hypothetical protein